MVFGKVFSFSPTFRAEKSKMDRHFIAVLMVETEMAFVEHDESLEIQEQYVTHVAQSVLKNCSMELDTLERDKSKLEAIQAPFPRITYDDAVDDLKKMGFTDIEWGDDFGAPH